MFVKKHIHTGEIYGGALSDILKSVFGKTLRDTVKTASKKALQTAAIVKQESILVKKQVTK